MENEVVDAQARRRRETKLRARPPSMNPGIPTVWANRPPIGMNPVLVLCKVDVEGSCQTIFLFEAQQTWRSASRRLAVMFGEIDEPAHPWFRQ